MNDNEIISKAMAILESRVKTRGDVLGDPASVRKLLRLKLQELEHEVFVVLFLDNQHRVIEVETMFRGTIDGCSVHPREVVKRALVLNSCAIIFAHNHPSGISEPSQADQRLTDRLICALKFVDVRVLDHFIVGDTDILSFAERGLL